MPVPILSLPTAPSLLSLLTPSVTAPAEAGAVDFAAMIASLGPNPPSVTATPPALPGIPTEAPLALPLIAPPETAAPPTTGTPLPQERPIVAAAPEADPSLDVEQVMIGSEASLARAGLPTKQPVTTDGDATPLPQCNLAILPRWTMPKAAPVQSTPVLSVPAPVQSKPAAQPIILRQQVIEHTEPAEPEALPEKDEAPVLIAQVAIPQLPPAPSFAPIAWIAPVQPEPMSEQPRAPTAAAVAPPLPSLPGITVPTQLVEATQHLPVTAPAPAAAPFVLPPEVARQVAQMVQAAFADEPGEPAPSIDAPAPIAQPAPATTAAPSFVAQPLLSQVDTGRAEWMQAMIERIGDIAQVDGKREAQIRVLPDSLGAIEVKIEQRQDRMHVTLVSENAQTRQLLAEAAPRLQELAEARGLRFAQTGIGGGDTQDRRPAPEHPQPQLPARPASALAADEDEPTGDLIA